MTRLITLLLLALFCSVDARLGGNQQRQLSTSAPTDTSDSSLDSSDTDTMVPTDIDTSVPTEIETYAPSDAETVAPTMDVTVEDTPVETQVETVVEETADRSGPLEPADDEVTGVSPSATGGLTFDVESHLDIKFFGGVGYLPDPDVQAILFDALAALYDETFRASDVADQYVKYSVADIEGVYDDASNTVTYQFVSKIDVVADTTLTPRLAGHVLGQADFDSYIEALFANQIMGINEVDFRNVGACPPGNPNCR